MVTNRLVPLFAKQSLSERVTRCLSEMIVLSASNQVHWNVRLFFQGGDFEAPHNLNVPLTHRDRLYCLCFCHSRVVRCDFTEG